MTPNIGYEINEKDIDSTIVYLKTQNKPNSREDAINYLQEKAAVAHIAAHQIVEDEQSGKIDPVKLKR